MVVYSPLRLAAALAVLAAVGAAAAASAGDGVAEGAAEAGRLGGRALAGVRGRGQRPAVVRRQLAHRRPQALRQRALAVPPAQVAEELVQRPARRPGR